MRMETLKMNNAQRLDQQALIEVYDQYSPPLFRYAYRLLGDTDLAEECVAETFSRFLQVIAKGQGPRENLQAYLYRIAHNWITDQYRREPPPAELLEEDRHTDPLGNPVLVVSRELEQERVRSALLQLTPNQRRVVVLRFLEQWSHEQIAAAVGKTVEATRALQYRGLAVLRSLLVEPVE